MSISPTIWLAHFPHPAKSDTNYSEIDWQNPEVHDAEDGSQDNKIYIYHNSGHRLATISYLSWVILFKYNILSNLLLDDLSYFSTRKQPCQLHREATASYERP